jgi:hypothetical protein
VKRRLEAHMIEPIRSLMRDRMGLDVVTEEFSAGYGIADLVGAVMCKDNCRDRETMGIATPLDHRHFVEVLSELRLGTRRSIDSILDRVSFSESTFRKRILPRMLSQGLIERESGGYVRLLIRPPKPTRGIVAVEVKQTRWREALLQARRYTFFADQTYVAVWSETAARVDRTLLREHRIGLIGVEQERAEVLMAAPKRPPREPKMNRYCAEYLYREALCL